MVRWLCVLTHDFHYCLEVFFRATSILDSFLSVMKVGKQGFDLGGVLKWTYLDPAVCFCLLNQHGTTPKSIWACSVPIFLQFLLSS